MSLTVKKKNTKRVYLGAGKMTQDVFDDIFGLT
jgi:hypothetical protein